ncbi:MAG: MBL fold metallo-hydrolase [Candidatus Hodarchaeales archaeon]
MKMRIILGSFIFLALILSGLMISSLFTNPSEDEEGKNINDGEALQYKGVDIRWIGIGGFKIESKDSIIYIDPTDLSPNYVFPIADYIFITHPHIPHLSISDILEVSDENTIIIASASSLSQGLVSLPVKEVHNAQAGETIVFDKLSFKIVPSHNVDKFRPSGALYHPVGEGIGTIINLNDVLIYHAGDTDRIPEMKSIVCDIALLPITGGAWMTYTEAAEAVEDLKLSNQLKYVIPWHWDNTGSILVARDFESIANITVIILRNQYYWIKE